MKPFPLLIAISALALMAQKGDRLFPDIVPPEVLHRDVLRVDPTHYTKDFENEQTRVLRLRPKSDETVPMHEAQDGLFVCVNECHIRLTDPQGHLQDIHLENGQTRWVWAGTRTEKNLSTRSVEMLFIEMKPKP
jgi:hypothetical protein